MPPSPSSLSGSLKIVLSNTGPQGPVGPSNRLFIPQTLVDAPTVAWDVDLGGIGLLTIDGDRTIATPSHLLPGPYTLIVAQGGAGGFDLGFSDDFEFPTGEIPAPSPFPGAISVLGFVSDGRTLYFTGIQRNLAVGGDYLITEFGDFITDETGQPIIVET